MPQIAACSIREAVEADFPVLEAFYLAHEGKNIPRRGFREFQAVVRRPENLYLVAEMGGQVVAGAGLGLEAGVPCLIYGLVDPARCRQGIGTALLLTRLLLVPDESQITVCAVATTAPFFARIGFGWYANTWDGDGGLLWCGLHTVRAQDKKVLMSLLSSAGVTHAAAVQAQIVAASAASAEE